jgi:uncharacterized protein YfeS
LSRVWFAIARAACHMTRHRRGPSGGIVLWRSNVARVRPTARPLNVIMFSGQSAMANSQPPKLDPIFTDEANAYGPFGNDAGHDVLADYRRWRADGNRPGQFLPHLLRAWEIGDYDWDDQDANVIVEEMERSQPAAFERLTRDDVIIALAFTQIIVDGAAQPKVLERALKAVQRQSHDRIIEFRGWVDPRYRKEVLQKVAAFLAAARPAV